MRGGVHFIISYPYNRTGLKFLPASDFFFTYPKFLSRYPGVSELTLPGGFSKMFTMFSRVVRYGFSFF